MEVKGAERSDLGVEVERDRVKVWSEKSDFAWSETIHLPAEVNAGEHQMRLKNNFLEIRLSKRR